MKERQPLNYFEIPLLLSGRYTFGIAQLQVNFGPYVSFGGWGNWERKLKYGDGWSEKESKGRSPGKVWDAGLIVGAGVLLNRHFYIGLQCDFGLTDHRYYFDYSNGEKTKTRSYMISIGYNF